MSAESVNVGIESEHYNIIDKINYNI